MNDFVSVGIEERHTATCSEGWTEPTVWLFFDFIIDRPNESVNVYNYIKQIASDLGIGMAVYNEYVKRTLYTTGANIHVEFNNEEEALKFDKMVA